MSRFKYFGEEILHSNRDTEDEINECLADVGRLVNIIKSIMNYEYYIKTYEC